MLVCLQFRLCVRDKAYWLCTICSSHAVLCAMCSVMCFFPPERGVCSYTAGECGVNLLTQPLAFRSLRASLWKGKKPVRLQAADSISFCEQNLQSRQKRRHTFKTDKLFFNGYNHSGFEMRTVLLRFLTDKATVRSPVGGTCVFHITHKKIYIHITRRGTLSTCDRLKYHKSELHQSRCNTPTKWHPCNFTGERCLTICHCVHSFSLLRSKF